MKYRLSEQAEASIERIDFWWRSNRPAAPSAFEEDVNAALAILTNAPLTGAEWAVRKGVRVRRILLTSRKFYLYYTIENGEIVVLKVHGTPRGRGPILG